MAHNVPRDYLDYDPEDDSLDYDERYLAHFAQVLSHAPCFNLGTDNLRPTNAIAMNCFNTMMRLAYLNQQQVCTPYISHGIYFNVIS
jgi:hypothetical protein